MKGETFIDSLAESSSCLPLMEFLLCARTAPPTFENEQ